MRVIYLTLMEQFIIVTLNKAANNTRSNAVAAQMIQIALWFHAITLLMRTCNATRQEKCQLLQMKMVLETCTTQL